MSPLKIDRIVAYCSDKPTWRTASGIALATIKKNNSFEFHRGGQY